MPAGFSALQVGHVTRATVPASWRGRESVRQHRCTLSFEVGAVARDDRRIHAASDRRDEGIPEPEPAACPMALEPRRAGGPCRSGSVATKSSWGQQSRDGPLGASAIPSASSSHSDPLAQQGRQSSAPAVLASRDKWWQRRMAASRPLGLPMTRLVRMAHRATSVLAAALLLLVMAVPVSAEQTFDDPFGGDGIHSDIRAGSKGRGHRRRVLSSATAPC